MKPLLFFPAWFVVPCLLALAGCATAPEATTAAKPVAPATPATPVPAATASAPAANATVSVPPAPTPPAPFSPAVLPGSGLGEHPFLYAGEWNYPKKTQSILIVRDGKIVWSYEIATNIPGPNGTKTLQEFSDATMLSNGNVVFARKTGAGEVTPDKKLVWNYDAPPGFEVHTIQPIGTDRVMIVQNGNPAKLMIINTVTGQTEKELVLPTGNPQKAHNQFRGVRMTAAGTFLAAHMDNGTVSEYDADGKQIWSAAVPSPWAAVRLKNGNTLVTSNHSFMREINPQGETVWEFSQKDVPDIKIFVIQEAERLANGNTVFCNWCPYNVKNPKDWPGTVQVIEVTPDKKVVWALRSWDAPADLGPASIIQLLDEPGVPEKPGDQLR
ncbi:MAG: PQQ-binding-like beta-propeller repeat protein [Opitutales bacterium]|jgi:hypothetical protein